MDKQEFYLNQSLNHECFKLPERDKNYLLKNNYLNEYFTDKEKAQVRSNLGITPLLDELKRLILAKVFDEQGNVTFDLEPHEDEFSKVLSSATIYQILLKYYTKEELDQWREELIDEFNQLKKDSKVIIDNKLDEDSENPVQNKIIYNIIKSIENSYNRLANTKADKEDLDNYYDADIIDNILLNYIQESDLKNNYYTKEQIDTLISEGVDIHEATTSMIDSLFDNQF